MNLVRYSGILAFAIAAACSGGGGGSTGPGGNNNGGTGGNGGGGGPDPYGGGGGGTCPSGSVCYLTGSFSPSSITVVKGATVNFVNNSGVTHTTVFDGTRPPGVADIPENNSGTFPRTFSDVGTFPFHCTIHAGMNGTVIVQ